MDEMTVEPSKSSECSIDSALHELNVLSVKSSGSSSNSSSNSSRHTSGNLSLRSSSSTSPSSSTALSLSLLASMSNATIGITATPTSTTLSSSTAAIKEHHNIVTPLQQDMQKFNLHYSRPMNVMSHSIYPSMRLAQNSHSTKLHMQLNPRYISKVHASTALDRCCTNHNYNRSSLASNVSSNTSAAAAAGTSYNYNNYYFNKSHNNDLSSIYSTSSPRKMPETPLRMRPYFVPERTRTKSESADTTNSIYAETRTIVDAVLNNCGHINYGRHGYTTAMDTCDNLAAAAAAVTAISDLTFNCKQKLAIIIKKSKSLEDVRAENLDGSQPSHEMEFVSSRIQKLKVNE